MEEFARGFPNQHTTHRDTRYICMQTFVSARGPGNEGDGGNGRATGKTCGGDGGARRLRDCHERRLYARRVYIFIRVRSVKHARVHIANACAARACASVNACASACTHDDSES